MSQRPDRDAFFMAQAVLASTRSTCQSRAVGAVLVQDQVVRGTGYNGAPAGMPDCLEAGCDEDEHGACIRAIHAELNVILSTDAGHRRGATVYCTDLPCFRCASFLANAGIKRVVWARIFARHQKKVEKLFADSGVACDHYPLTISTTGHLALPESVMRRLGVSLDD